MPDPKVIKALPVILQRLHGTFPNARYELDWENPLQLLVATILAAQCTDERVNQVTKYLFPKYPDARAYADADTSELEEDLKPTGFYRQKAKTVQNVCRYLLEHHGGEVPVTMEEMVELPGVARKTANVVLNNAFQLPTGVIVDTHVQRVSQRMGLTDENRPEKIESDLMRIVPKEEWIFFGPAMVLLGRYICTHHAPDCAGCLMNDLCPKCGIDESQNTEPGDHTELTDSEEDTPNMAAKKTSPAKKTKAGKAAPTKKPAAKAAPAKAKTVESASIPSLKEQLPADWQSALAAEFDKPYFKQLEKFVAQERATQTVFPPVDDVFNAFKATPFEKVKVVLLGQDPYHGEGEAHGMCFSVRPGVKVPPSLVNIYKELADDLKCKAPNHGYLTAWANQGVLLLNTVLTVRANEAHSHKEQGWETFTDAVIKAINQRAKPSVFLLWGSPAQKKTELIDTKKHRVLTSAHPSPLSSKKFFGSKPFSGANAALKELGHEPINWQLPENPTDQAPPVASTPAPTKTTTATKPAVASPVQTNNVQAATAPTREELTHLETLLPADWREALAAELRKSSFKNLDKFLAGERKDAAVCPVEKDTFAAFRLTPLRSVKVVILGSEPPCAEDVADGLALSVRDDVEFTETTETMYKALRQDLGCRMPITGSLEGWARQGVLLLNTILTVRAGRPGSHKDKGWEAFTDAVLKTLFKSKTPIVFVLWGSTAMKKLTSLVGEVDANSLHAVVYGEHPGISPAKFLDSGMFPKINESLEMRGRMGISWQIRYA